MNVVHNEDAYLQVYSSSLIDLVVAVLRIYQVVHCLASHPR